MNLHRWIYGTLDRQCAMLIAYRQHREDESRTHQTLRSLHCSFKAVECYFTHFHRFGNWKYANGCFGHYSKCSPMAHKQVFQRIPNRTFSCLTAASPTKSGNLTVGEDDLKRDHLIYCVSVLRVHV